MLLKEMDMIRTLDPHYNLPGRTYFSQTLIPQMYKVSVSSVKASLSKASVVALTTDGWTNRATESYVTSHLSILLQIGS